MYNSSATLNQSNSSWYYEPIPTFWLLIQASFLSGLTLLTVFGNGMVLACLWRYKHLRSQSTYSFYASLACSDFLIGK